LKKQRYIFLSNVGVSISIPSIAPADYRHAPAFERFYTLALEFKRESIEEWRWRNISSS
jgi:hypothetical protein